MDYEHIPHPHIERRKHHGPVKIADQHPTGSAYARFNRSFAVWTTGKVGTMTCAYLFTVLALTSLPATISSHSVVNIVQWIAQTFFQLVLLSVILVGQNVLADAADKRSEATYKDAEAVLHEAAQIQRHLAVQDGILGSQNQVLTHLVEVLDSIIAKIDSPPEASS